MHRGRDPNARREVPLHPDLITLGFLTYVNEMRRAGHRRLFPKLEPYRGRYAKNIGRWLNRLLDEADPSLTLTTLASAAAALGRKVNIQFAAA